MKQFDFELVKAGHPVCTNIGEPVEIIKYDYHGGHPIIAIVDQGERQVARLYDLDGKHGYGDDFLMMAPIKHEGWVNIYRDGGWFGTSVKVYQTKEGAIKEAVNDKTYIGTTKLEWEE